MLNSNPAIDIVIRLSIVLAIGWLSLRVSAKQNPRWSVLITRCMIIAGFGFPVVYACLPATTLAVLPALSEVEVSQPIMTMPKTIETVIQGTPPNQPLEQTSERIREPVIVGTESSLLEPARRDSETTVMVPENNVEPPSVAPGSPVGSIYESPRNERQISTIKGGIIPVESSGNKSAVSLFDWLGVCWLAGCFLLLLKIGFQIRQAKQLLQTSQAASELIQCECEMLARNLSLHSVPRVCVSTAINGPCTAGLLRPSIFLPDSWSESLSDEERRAVLMHELSHIAGCDSLWDLLSRIVTALWWFHPLVWRLTSQHRLACEHMSDACAADSIDGFDAYRQMLAQWTLRRQGAETNSTVLAMADRSFMLRRLKWLESPQPFGTLRRARRTAVLLIAVLFFLGVASIKFIPQAVAQKKETVEQEQKTEESKPSSTEQENAKKENTEKNRKEQPGLVIRVKAVDANGKPLKDAYPLLEDSNLFGREFKRDKDHVGYFTSPVLSPDRRWMRVVDGSGEGPILFSKLIDVTKPEQVTQDGTIVATLRPGIRLEGRLDENVPRPIKNGCVELYINEGEGHRIGGWTWQDTAFVKKDGTFVFESLPAGGHVQMFALVEGFQSIRLAETTLAEYLRLHDAGDVSLLEAFSKDPNVFRPQLFPLPKGQAKTEITVPCTRSAALDVTVFHPTGPPISDAKVKFNPRGLFLGGKEFFPTNEVLSKASLVRQQDPVQAKRLHDWANSTFLEVKTDSKGIARVRNLPTQGRQKFYAKAPRVTMPAYPTIDSSFPSHYAVIDLTAEKTLQRTITMENLLPIVSHKVIVMDDKGAPLPMLKLTVSEITFKNAPDNWHVWSKQRFGTVPTGTTDVNGKASLRLPLRVNDQTVTRMRVILKGDISQDVPIYKHLMVPLDSDERRHLLIVSKPIIREIKNLHDVEVELVPYETFGGNSPKQVLDAFRKSPSLVLFKRLLETVNYDAATPIQIQRQLDWAARSRRMREEGTDLFIRLNQMNWDVYELQKYKKLPDGTQYYKYSQPNFYRQNANEREKEEDEFFAYRTIPTDRGERTVVLCQVAPVERPLKAAQPEKQTPGQPAQPQEPDWKPATPEPKKAPVVAFVFNTSDGSLIRSFGDPVESGGMEMEPILTCMGGTDDIILLTSTSETFGPFNKKLCCYRIGAETKPLLTVYTNKNVFSWHGTFRPSSPLAESGYVEFGLGVQQLKGKQFDRTRGGMLSNGIEVPRKIYWDGRQNQFMGPVTQSYDGVPLYQVVPEKSAEFQPLDIATDEMMVAGGRGSSQNWHSWDVLIPHGKTARLRFTLEDQSGGKPVVQEIAEKELSAGLHNLSFQIAYHSQDEDLSQVKFRFDEKTVEEILVPRVPIVTDEPSVAGAPVVRTGSSTMVLFDRPTKKANVRLVLKLILQ